MNDSKIVSFLRRESNSLNGRGIPSHSFNQMCSLSFRELEDSHDIIQWMFPLPEASKFNPFAPLLKEEDIAVIKSDDIIRGNILCFFEKMLNFYGLEVDEDLCFVNVKDRDLNFRKSSQFKFRAPEWIHRENHNYLRITRILRCLYLVGYEKIAQSFFKLLEELYNQNKPVIDSSTCEYWRMACGLKPWNPEGVK